MGTSVFGDQYIFGAATTADAAAFAAATDYEVTVDIACPDWSPAVEVQLAGHWGAAGNRSWQLVLTTAGALRLDVSADGTAIVSGTSSANLAATPANGRLVVRALLDTATGNVDFSSGATLAALAALGAQQAGAGAIVPFNSTAVLSFGAANHSLFRGTLSVDGGVTDVADAVAANVKQYQDSYRDAYGRLWAGAGADLFFQRVYPTTAVGLLAPAAAPVQPVSPVPALPEMSTRINLLSMVPVTGPTAPDPNA